MTAMLPRTSWGAWSIGDLADTARRVADLVGPTAVVESLQVNKPVTGDVPEVHLAVGDETDVAELREEVQNGEFVVEFFGARAPWVWHADVAGLELTVETEGQFQW